MKRGAIRRGGVRRDPPINLKVGDFLARTMKPEDARPAQLKWFADERMMEPLNMPVRRLDLQGLQQFYLSFDNYTRYLAGVFDANSGEMLSMFMSEHNRQHAVMRVSFLNGGLTRQTLRGFLATEKALVSLLFRKYGAQKIIAHVNAENRPIRRNVEAIGFELEGIMKGQVRSPKTGERRDQAFYGVLKEDWFAARAREEAGRGAGSG